MVNFSVKVFYSFIESEGGETFPIQVVWNLWLCEGGLLWLGSSVEGLGFGSVKKERFGVKWAAMPYLIRESLSCRHRRCSTMLSMEYMEEDK